MYILLHIIKIIEHTKIRKAAEEALMQLAWNMLFKEWLPEK
jgi:hypothetical protein